MIPDTTFLIISLSLIPFNVLMLVLLVKIDDRIEGNIFEFFKEAIRLRPFWVGFGSVVPILSFIMGVILILFTVISLYLKRFPPKQYKKEQRIFI